jgi:hypothetical protein
MLAKLVKILLKTLTRLAILAEAAYEEEDHYGINLVKHWECHRYLQVVQFLSKLLLNPNPYCGEL